MRTRNRDVVLADELLRFRVVFVCGHACLTMSIGGRSAPGIVVLATREIFLREEQERLERIY